MNEIFPKINPTSEDEKEMDKVLYQAKEILANAVADDIEKEKNGFSEFSSLPEDEKKTESILNEVKEILVRAAEDDKISKGKLNDITEKNEKELFDESSDFYMNVEKGSVSELFFKTLAEEIPSLCLSIDKKALSEDGIPLKNYVAIKMAPYVTDREFIFDLNNNDIIDVLRHPERYSERDMRELEKLGIISKDFFRRALIRQYEFYAKKWPEVNFWKGEIKELGDVTPFSDEEIQEIMRKVILGEFKKRLNGD